ncbi:VOC family protein [Aeromicrobium sp. IC_218]|uniref:VOC family protein n=1 Tax=Aeromicrobium sp. IC_218 TaxID=2545468 RepID=UPI00103D98F9|nr:VOC family protein [Aeromicrobium sp. IC_218]TCI99376.1 VOC family protein [Aeromicrobium sp. IC_218]
MTAPVPYLLLPGTARDALRAYAETFGGQVELHTYADFGRDDGPGDAVAHGHLGGGPVELFAADVTGDEASFRAEGLLLSLLGAADPDTAHAWFTALRDGGRVVSDLQQRPWGASDGQVVDRFGVPWLLGYEPA